MCGSFETHQSLRSATRVYEPLRIHAGQDSEVIRRSRRKALCLEYGITSDRTTEPVSSPSPSSSSSTSYPPSFVALPISWWLPHSCSSGSEEDCNQRMTSCIASFAVLNGSDIHQTDDGSRGGRGRGMSEEGMARLAIRGVEGVLALMCLW